MKNLKLILIATLLPIASLVAQIPQAMKYQTVIRNASGEPIANTNVGLRLTVVEDGQGVYEETYDLNTDARGLVSLNIGEGSTSDNFSSIAWDGNDYELEVEVDINGGSNYQFVGSSTLLSVPFAMTAQRALNVEDEQLAKCWANVNVTGSVNTTFDAYNVLNVSKNLTGVYIVSLPPGLFSTATNPSVVATVYNDLSPGFVIPTFSSAPGTITFRTYDSNGNPSDRGFSFTVHGK